MESFGAAGDWILGTGNWGHWRCSALYAIAVGLPFLLCQCMCSH